MGGPASPTAAEIYMQAHEHTALSSTLHLPKVWERFVDNVYSILKLMDLEKFTIASTIFIKILSVL